MPALARLRHRHCLRLAIASPPYRPEVRAPEKRRPIVTEPD
jgi:hypothetical protein